MNSVDHPRDVLAALRVELGQRDASPLDRAPGPSAARRTAMLAGHSLLRRGRAAPYASSASRATAPRTPPVRSYAAMAQAPAVAAAARAPAARSTAGEARRARPRRPRRGRRRARARPAGPTRSAGPLDGVAQLVAPHRGDEHMVGGQQRARAPGRRHSARMVGADREHDDGAAERVAAAPRARPMNSTRSRSSRADGEDLLELVDGDQEAARPRRPPARGSSSRCGCSPGPDQRPAATPRCPAGCRLERGQQARRAATEDLPVPDGADDRRAAVRRPAARRARPRAARAEEVVRVLGLERREALERADDRRPSGVDRQRDALARPLEIDDALGDLGLHRAQPARPAAASLGRRPQTRSGRLAARPLAGEPRGRALGTPWLASRSALDRDELGARGRPRRRARSPSTAAASSGSSVDLERRVAVEPRRASSPSASRSTGRPSRAGQRARARPRSSAPARSASSTTSSVGCVACARARSDAERLAAGRRPPRAARGAARVRPRGRARRRAGSCRSRAAPVTRHDRARAAARPRPSVRAASASSASRPAKGASPPVSSARGSSARGRASSDGSWRRIASCSAPQLRPGLDADLLDERAPRLAVDLERLGLAPAAIEREHQLPGEPLAVAVLGDELLQLADERGVAARRPGRRRRAASSAVSRSSSSRAISVCANGS